ncbi:4Fe-4S cluster-binding domain-containing protein [Clostridiaceae bacterium HSG29]|nr:4Fe-4S cluster-binding domain-containing protein [Clostridiaceae bacterium HSG29]
MIKYKGIIHNILNDAPFIGALVIAPTCSRGCKNCINEHLKHNGIFYEESAEDVIKKVKSNGLNRGIIMSGLEWTESPESMIKLVDEALKNDLNVIIYTHNDEDVFLSKFPNLRKKEIYIKYGKYEEDMKAAENIHFGVRLATTNQYIKYYGAC